MASSAHAIKEQLDALRHPARVEAGHFLFHCFLPWDGLYIYEDEYGVTLHWLRHGVFCDITPDCCNVYRVDKVGSDSGPEFFTTREAAQAALTRSLVSLRAFS